MSSGSIRIIQLPEKSSVNTDDYMAVDSSANGTKKVKFTDLLDNNLSVQNKAADAQATGEAINNISARVDNMINTQTNESVTTLWTGQINLKNETANLSESINNFDFIDVYCGGVDTVFARQHVSGSSVHFELQSQNMSDNASVQFMRWWETGLIISGTTATINKAIKCFWDDFSTAPIVSQATGGGIDIVRIDGVKIGHADNDEIVDARVGANGTTYPTLGDAIRGQVTDLKSDLINYEKYIVGKSDLTDAATWIDGYAIIADGTIAADSDVHYSSLISVDNIVYHLIANNTGTSSATVRIHGYDANDTWVEQITYRVISSGQTVDIAIDISNTNVKKIRISAPKVVDIISLYTGETLQKELQKNIDDIVSRTGEQLYDSTTFGWVYGMYITTGGAIGSTIDMTGTTNPSYCYTVAPVTAGDRFVVTALGGGDPRAWAFTDNSYKLISNSASSHNANAEVVVAENDGYLIVNSNISADESLVKTAPITVPEYTDEECGEINDKLDMLFSTDTVKTAITSGWVYSAYMKTARALGATITKANSEISMTGYRYIILPVEEGDTFELTGTGGGDPRLFAWLDTSNKLIANSPASASLTDATLVAPQDGYLIVNVNLNYTYSIKSVEVVTTINFGMLDVPILSLTDFGAVGDGVTDDSNAIQAALNAAGGRELYIPSGEYLFSRTLFIKSGTRLFGSGESSVLKQTDSFTFTPYAWRTGDELVTDHYRYPMIMIASTESDCILENFKIDGQTAEFIDKNCDGLTVCGNNHIINNIHMRNIDFFPSDFGSRTCDVPGYGINIMGTTVTVKNCDVSDCGYEAIGTENANTVLIENCKVGYNVQTGIQVHRNSDHIRILNNTVRCYDGISDYRPALTLHAATEHPMQDIVISGNYLVSSLMFANGGGENDVRITDNYMVSIGVNDFVLPDLFRKNWSIIGNRLTGGIKAKCDNIIIANNIFTSNDASPLIHVKSNSHLIDNNLICGASSDIVVETH